MRGLYPEDTLWQSKNPLAVLLGIFWGAISVFLVSLFLFCVFTIISHIGMARGTPVDPCGLLRTPADSCGHSERPLKKGASFWRKAKVPYYFPQKKPARVFLGENGTETFAFPHKHATFSGVVLDVRRSPQESAGVRRSPQESATERKFDFDKFPKNAPR